MNKCVFPLLGAILSLGFQPVQAEVCAAVSLSIPSMVLLSINQQSQQAGVRMVVRGVPDADPQQLDRSHWGADSNARVRQRSQIQEGFHRLSHVARQLGAVIEIDPKVFQEAKLERVPAWVWRGKTAAQVQDVRVILGSVSLSWAAREWLQSFETEGNEQAVREMREILERLGEEV